MVSLSTWTYLIWLGGLAVQTGASLIMLRKRLFQELPIFFAYTVFHVVRSLCLLGIKQYWSLTTYSYSYWSAEVISAVMGFAVIYEVFAKVLDPYAGLRRLGMMLLGWAAFVMVILAIGAASSTGAEQSGMITAVFAFERSIR